MNNADAYHLNEKLIKWAGYEYSIPAGCNRKAWHNNKEIYIGDLPDFTSSLDRIFEWLVPKLKSIGYMARVQYSPLRDNDTGKLICDWTGYASVYDVSGKRGLNHFEEWAIASTPPLSLCLAIEKLVDAGVC